MIGRRFLGCNLVQICIVRLLIKICLANKQAVIAMRTCNVLVRSIIAVGCSWLNILFFVRRREPFSLWKTAFLAGSQVLCRLIGLCNILPPMISYLWSRCITFATLFACFRLDRTLTVTIESGRWLIVIYTLLVLLAGVGSSLPVKSWRIASNCWIVWVLNDASVTTVHLALLLVSSDPIFLI